jgi:hypothetical protein
MQPWSNACESDTDIYQRLVETCYQQLGRWKRWLPYYGITDVIEVKVRVKTPWYQKDLTLSDSSFGLPAPLTWMGIIPFI